MRTLKKCWWIGPASFLATRWAVIEELEAPSAVASLHAEVAAWLRSITDAGAMVREAVEGADPAELAAAR